MDEVTEVKRERDPMARVARIFLMRAMVNFFFGPRGGLHLSSVCPTIFVAPWLLWVLAHETMDSVLYRQRNPPPPVRKDWDSLTIVERLLCGALLGLLGDPGRRRDRELGGAVRMRGEKRRVAFSQLGHTVKQGELVAGRILCGECVVVSPDCNFEFVEMPSSSLDATVRVDSDEAELPLVLRRPSFRVSTPIRALAGGIRVGERTVGFARVARERRRVDTGEARVCARYVVEGRGSP